MNIQDYLITLDKVELFVVQHILELQKVNQTGTAKCSAKILWCLVILRGLLDRLQAQMSRWGVWISMMSNGHI